MKYSIIIPTLWRSPEQLETMLKLYRNHYMVREIIIINNARELTPDWFDESHQKMIVVKPPRNIFVNPAWNLGVDISRSDYIALVNDDLLMDHETLTDILTQSYMFLSDGVFQLIGMAEHNFVQNKASFTHHPQLSSITKKGHGFGTFMLMQKRNYVPIPNCLKIWRGDHIQLIHNNTGELGGIHIETKMSTTINSDQIFNQIGKRDMNIFRNHYQGKTLPKLYND
jgi:hypothetical protein